ncbi:MAG: sirohydrochlorin chelatase [Cyanobium sp. NAT70]|mgnify:CR=1 FL=1|nr:sirohydrochlorin chelatase [Cyanobium sp. NAT70]|tara:strand:+ start:2237 stop:3424 length:1188 start_codon:yes stop_codon:yes gene_type:complete
MAASAASELNTFGITGLISSRRIRSDHWINGSNALADFSADRSDDRLGVLICGHGSRNRLAVEEFAQMVEALRPRLSPLPVEHGYLEFARPILRDGLEALRHQGVTRILAIPAMLFAAGHAKNDIPSVLNTYTAESSLPIDYGRELGVDRLMVAAAGARIQETLEKVSEDIPMAETLLVVVGRGSSDPDANSNVAKVTRMLVEGFGFGWGETVYSGVTFPLVEPGLRHVVRLGFKRIVVAPYFLFSGVLVSRILQHTQRVAKDHPQVEFLSANYLGDHPLVVETFRERVLEVLRGDTAMNCSLCKYRAQVLGFEQDVGLAQESHHHHVEGLAESCTLCERECTGACQPDGIPILPHNHDHDHSHADHGHHHPPYPHALHPLGPTSLNPSRSSSKT